MDRWRQAILSRLAPLKLAPAREAEIVEELAQHLEDRHQELVAGGATEEEARRVALEELSDENLLARGLRRVEEEVKYEPIVPGGRGINNFLADIWQDVRYGVRMLRNNPGFTVVAVITLALGIGANTAIFSVVNGVLLKPLAYRDPERIVTILHYGWNPVAPADFLDWRAQSQSFEAMAAAEAWGGILTGDDQPEAVPGIRFGEGVFQILGVQPLMGRTFQADDFRPGRDRVIVLSYRLWQQRFGGDPKIVGQSFTLNGESYTVVGVMPPQFRFTPFWVTKAEMAAPLDLVARATAAHG